MWDLLTLAEIWLPPFSRLRRPMAADVSAAFDSQMLLSNGQLVRQRWPQAGHMSTIAVRSVRRSTLPQSGRLSDYLRARTWFCRREWKGGGPVGVRAYRNLRLNLAAWFRGARASAGEWSPPKAPHNNVICRPRFAYSRSFPPPCRWCFHQPAPPACRLSTSPTSALTRSAFFGRRSQEAQTTINSPAGS